MRKFFSKHKKLKLSLIVAAIVLAAYWHHHQSLEHSSLQQLYTVKRGNIVAKATAPGVIVPERETVVTAPYNGYIKKIYVKTGEAVKPNDPLVSVVQSLQSNEQVFPIRAPYAGKVALINKTEGEYVNATSSSDTQGIILKIDDTSALYVNADVSEMDISKIKPGQKVIIKPSADNAKTYKGEVMNVSFAPKPQESSLFGQQQVVYVVRIKVVSKARQALYPGMSVLSDIIITKKQKVIIVPHQYLHHGDSGYYVVNKDGKHLPVTLGVQTPLSVEIIKGLPVGTQIKAIDYFSEAA